MTLGETLDLYLPHDADSAGTAAFLQMRDPRGAFLSEASINYWITMMHLEDLAFGDANVNRI